MWSLPPSGPITSIRRRSIAMWMSSSPSSSGNEPPSISSATVAQALVDRCELVLVEDPGAVQGAGRGPSTARCRTGPSRRSKPIEALSRTKSGIGRIAEARHAAQSMNRVGWPPVSARQRRGGVAGSRSPAAPNLEGPVRLLVTGATGKVGNAVAAAGRPRRRRGRPGSQRRQGPRPPARRDRAGARRRHRPGLPARGGRGRRRRLQLHGAVRAVVRRPGDLRADQRRGGRAT